MQHHSITAVLVTYQSEAIIHDALSALAAIPMVQDIIVVDNASTDATTTYAQEYAKVCVNEQNNGFGAASNRGIKQAATDYVLLINPDASIKAADLELLVQALDENNNAVVASPSLLHPCGTLQDGIKPFVFTREKTMPLQELPQAITCAFYVPGAVWLVRKRSFETLGGFDERFFLFYEDDDFCMRAAHAGYSVLYVPQAMATHTLGGSSRPDAKLNYFKQYQISRSRLLLEEKHHGTPRAMHMARRMLWRYSGKGLLYMLLFQKVKARRYLARPSAAVDYIKANTL